jgi:hypothetical protein
VDFEARRAAYDERAQAMVGERLARVRYYEICYEGSQPSWDTGIPGVVDVPDFGLDLEMESGRVFGIVWDWEFTCYHLKVVPTSLAGIEVGHAAVWDVSSQSGWPPLIGRAIAGVAVHWWPTWSDDPVPLCPLHLDIVFEDGQKVFISAAIYDRERDSLFGLSDEVVVIFGEEAARRYRVDRYQEFDVSPGTGCSLGAG